MNKQIIREQSGNNIKHYTLNTKHKTLDINTNTQDLPSGESSEMDRPKAPSGLASLSSEASGKVICSGEVIPALRNHDFSYLTICVKRPVRQDRLEVNVDFRLNTSIDFNKLVFNLVGWDRRREFFDNISEQDRNWQGYQAAYAQQDKESFIGKGRLRAKYIPNKTQNRTAIKAETALLIQSTNQGSTAHIWIEDSYFVLPFEKYQDKNNLFCLRADYITSIQAKSARGGWL